MLCMPRSIGSPAFVIEYIWRENRIRSVSLRSAARRGAARSVTTSFDSATGDVGRRDAAREQMRRERLGRLRFERAADGLAARGASVVAKQRHPRLSPRGARRRRPASPLALLSTSSSRLGGVPASSTPDIDFMISSSDVTRSIA